jgi:hypothetical protein
MRTDNSTVINIETQKGSYRNNGHNYVIHSEGEVLTLKERIKAQEEEILFLRQQVSQMTK